MADDTNNIDIVKFLRQPVPTWGKNKEKKI